MTERDFAYWLQGFVEINGDVPTQAQWDIIKDHLQLVFKKETPEYSIGVSNGGLTWPYEPVITC